MILYASKFDEELVFEKGKVVGVRGTETRIPKKKNISTETRFNAHVTGGSRTRRIEGTGHCAPISTTHSMVIAKHYANAYTGEEKNQNQYKSKIVAICIDEEALDSVPEFFDSKKISGRDSFSITSSKGETIRVTRRNRNYLNASQEVVFMENIISSDAIHVVELPEKISDIAYAYSVIGGILDGKKMADQFIECYVRNPEKVIECIEKIESGMSRDETWVRTRLYEQYEGAGSRETMEVLDRLFEGVLDDEMKERVRNLGNADEKNKYGIKPHKLLATFTHAMSIRKIISDKEFSSLIGIEPKKNCLDNFTGIMYGAPRLINTKVNIIKDGEKKHPTYGDVLRLDEEKKIDGKSVKGFYRNWATELTDFEIQRHEKGDKKGRICGFKIKYAIEREVGKDVYDRGVWRTKKVIRNMRYETVIGRVSRKNEEMSEIS